MRKSKLYPDIEEAEKERSAWKKNISPYELPDFIAEKPNYSKFYGWTVEEVLVFLNMD